MSDRGCVLIAGEPKAGVEHLEPYGFTEGQTAVRKRWCCFRMATVLMGGCYGVGPSLPPERAADG